jgi:hypothetical protein
MGQRLSARQPSDGSFAGGFLLTERMELYLGVAVTLMFLAGVSSLS